MSGPFDDLIPAKAPGAIAPKGMIYSPPADSLGQQQKAVTLGKSATEADIAAATKPDAIRKAKSEADLAALNVQEKKDQLLAQNGVPAPGDTTKTGDAYLSTLPSAIRNQAIAMIEGRTPYPTGAALKSPQMQTIIAAAQQADPTYDYANAKTRLKTREDFTSGNSARNLTAVNTALGHLGQLMQDAQALHNTGSPLLNQPLNAIRGQVFGSGKITALNTDIQAVSDELEKAFRGTNGTETGVQGWKQNFSQNASPDQILQAGQAAAKLLMGRLQNLTGQYNQGMGRSSDAMTFLNPHAQAVLQGITSGNIAQIPSTLPKGFDQAPITAAWLPGDHGAPPPPPASGPVVPPTIGGPKAPPSAPGALGVPSADFSGMVGGPNQNAVTTDPNSKLGAFQQTYKNVFDPAMASAVSAFIRKGTDYNTVATFAQGHGFTPPSPQEYQAAVSFAKQHNGATNVESNRSVPTTIGERLATSPAAAAVAGFGSGSTAGLQDVLGRTLAGDQWDANRAALAATNPGADAAGNLAGGVAGALALPELAGRLAPGATAKLASFAEDNPLIAKVAGNATYGGTYGATQDPNNPLGGALKGAVMGAIAAPLAETGVKAAGSVFSPSAGALAPLYEAGVFPTLGQRFARSGIAGRSLNLTEQAMQSVPGWGAAPAAARQATRDAFQVGAFNNSLKELAPFQQIGGNNVATALPKGVGPGTAAHAFASDAFNQAYPIARSGMQFAPDTQFTQDLGQWQQDLGKGILTQPEQAQVQNYVQNAVGSRMNNGVLDGNGYQQAASDIGQAVQAWGKDPAKAQMAHALGDFGSIFDNAARRSSDPQASALLDAADRGYAQLVRIQRASEMGGAAKDAGTFTPPNYAGAAKQMGGGVRSSAWNTGDALGQDYAQAGLNLNDKLADSGTPIRLGVLGALQGAEGAGLAATHGLSALLSPKLAAAFAPYLPGVSDVVKRAIAPNAQRLSFLPQPAADAIAPALDWTGGAINNVAPLIGKGAIPGALAYYGGNQ